MPFTTKRQNRPRWIRLAILVAFIAHGVTFYTLLPCPPIERPELPLSRIDTVMIASLGLVCLAAAYLAFKIFLRTRTKYEELLRRSEDFARATVDALPAHIAIVDQWGAILSTNRPWKNFARQHGADPAKVGDGANYLAECDRAAARGCADAAAIGHALRAILAGKQENFALEYPFHPPASKNQKHDDSARRWFEVRISRFPDGKAPCACVAHEDVTAQKLAEEEQKNAKREAEAANAAKTAFIANTSHEIRTPMNAILGYADILLDPTCSDEQRRNCVKVIRRNGEHLLAIINDILDISKVEACRMSAERITCDLPQLVADVIGLTQSRAIEKGLAFEVTFDELIPKTILTDPVRAKQVLVNLVGNAVKFTKTGSVKLHVARDVTYFGHTIRFSVTDTGIGITPEQMARLFQPFSQADGSTTRQFGGTGLGLSISKRLAQILGGDIAVESPAAPDQPNPGSTFRFWLDGGPREGVELLKNFTREQLDVPDLSPTAQPAPIHLRGNILLAEDGEDNQHLLITFLSQAGIEVTLAPNGQTALQLALAGNFDLVLMDMQMPVLDGYRAAAELRKSGYTKPIVALTAHAMADDRQKCLAAGCSDYLSKPIDRHRLLMTCASYLPAAILELKPETATTPALAPAEAPPPAQSLRSSLADDPRVAKVLDRFISRLPERVTAIQQCLDEGDLESLRHAVHNLKGAGSGYGFAPLTEQSTRAEEALKSQKSLDEIRTQVDELISLIQRVEGYKPSPAAEPQRA
jgi:signal transduction histidine kinase/DNA-binding NarL/FixJ family response regulator